MQASNLTIAKERLQQGKLGMVIVKKETVIFETSAQGIGGLLTAIEELDKEMKGSSVADKVVGKAAALLCVHAGVSAVFAITASEEGIQVLKDNNVLFQFENRVPHILNPGRSSICPFEKLVINISNPKEAYGKLRLLAAERRLL